MADRELLPLDFLMSILSLLLLAQLGWTTHCLLKANPFSVQFAEIL